MNNWDYVYDSKFCSVKLSYLGFHSSSSIKLSWLLFFFKLHLDSSLLTQLIRTGIKKNVLSPIQGIHKQSLLLYIYESNLFKVDKISYFLVWI